jgi:hypothetical protein
MCPEPILRSDHRSMGSPQYQHTLMRDMMVLVLVLVLVRV